MDVTSEFVIASFALWAGDYQYLDTLIEKLPREKETEKKFEKSPESIINHIHFVNLMEYKKKRQHQASIKPIEFNQILETDNIRAKIWQISEFEYCLRGYLTSFGHEDKIFSHINPVPLTQLKLDESTKSERKQKVQRNFGKSWSLKGDNHCIIRIDEMGLIESTFFICKFDSNEKNEEIISVFSEVLAQFNDGKVRPSK